MKWKLVGVVMFFAVAILADCSGLRTPFAGASDESSLYGLRLQGRAVRPPPNEGSGTAPERRRPERLACLPRCGEGSLRQHPRRRAGKARRRAVGESAHRAIARIQTDPLLVLIVLKTLETMGPSLTSTFRLPTSCSSL